MKNNGDGDNHGDNNDDNDDDDGNDGDDDDDDASAVIQICCFYTSAEIEIVFVSMNERNNIFWTHVLLASFSLNQTVVSQSCNPCTKRQQIAL